jgi:outer membrane protein assembly factor BamB
MMIRVNAGRLAAVALLGITSLLCCAPREKILLLYPERSNAARHVLDVEFTRQLTLPENFLMRPDERAAVAVDHERDVVYVGSRGGTLLALDSGSGEVRWEHESGGPIGSIPVIADDGGLLLLGTDNGLLLALDLDTTSPRWVYETQGTIRNGPVVHEGVVYFVNSRGQVFAVDMRTGTWRWQYEREVPTDFTVHGRAGLTFAPSADQSLGRAGTIFTGFDDGSAVAIDASSGEALWITSVAPPAGGRFLDCDSTPLLIDDGDEVVVAGQETGVHGLSADDGTKRWSLAVRGAGSVVQGPGEILLFASSLEGLFAVERGGAIRWRQGVDPGVVSTPMVIQDTAFFTHTASGLLAYAARDGTYLGRFDTGTGMSSVPVYDAKGGRFYATSNRGVLFAFRVIGAGLQEG